MQLFTVVNISAYICKRPLINPGAWPRQFLHLFIGCRLPGLDSFYICASVAGSLVSTVFTSVHRLLAPILQPYIVPTPPASGRTVVLQNCYFILRLDL